ncbi:BPSS1780 family membrane protein [Methylophilaceae bacterium]|jgi:hypothetical protein|nr:BPSS1780 family membrane protein [Methylophilaceae bacterium]|tara:strand:+ start:953 stop:1699 length:747 start_codon:yes stop_codon:yes gene_type:complete
MLIKVKNWTYTCLTLFKNSVRQSLFLGMLYLTIFLFFPILPGLKLISPITIFLWPFIVLIFIHFYKELDEKRDFELKSIFNTLKNKFTPLLSIGGLSFIFATLVSFVFYSDVGQKTEEIESITEYSQRLLPTFTKIILISIPFFMATWFSPLLINYNNYGVLKAIKSSLAGALMFSIPLLLVWAILTGGFILIILLVSIVFSSLSFLGQNLVSFLSSLFLLLSFTAYISILFIFQYVSYKEIFGSLKN